MKAERGLSDQIHVVIIGGGATGVGIAREAAARGWVVTLIEKVELGSGTSGRFHGMLHSGARYAVNDTATAAECYLENQILRTLVPSAIIDTGGMFVAVNDVESDHADVVMQACGRAGIPTEEISPASARQLEPNLSSAVSRAFLVPDAFIDGVELIRLNKEAGLKADIPVKFLEQHMVEGFELHDGQVTAVKAKHRTDAAATIIDCDFVINAAGVWAGHVAALAGAPFDMVCDKGSMMVFDRQFSTRILNRCRPEHDGDLLVSSPEGSIMGTTARIVAAPDDHFPTQEEIDVLLREGSEMVPALRDGEVTRIYAGVRPLFGVSSPDGATRAISRAFKVLDHEAQGVSNMISVVGGKVTLYRRMAEAAVDMMAKKRVNQASTEPLFSAAE